MTHDVGDGHSRRPGNAGQTVHQYAAVGLSHLIDELRCFDEVGQEFLSVAVVDGKPEEIAVLDEIRFGAIGAHVDFVVDVVIQQELLVVSILLRSQVEEGQYPGGSLINDGQTGLRQRCQSRTVTSGLVFAQVTMAGLKMQKTTSEEEKWRKESTATVDGSVED